MKHKDTLLTLCFAGAICAMAFLMPATVPDPAEPQQSIHEQKQQEVKKVEVVLGEKVIYIVPASSEAAKIPPGLLAELKAVGEL